MKINRNIGEQSVRPKPVTFESLDVGDVFIVHVEEHISHPTIWMKLRNINDHNLAVDLFDGETGRFGNLHPVHKLERAELVLDPDEIKKLTGA
jgi:hypothetical protein